MPETKLNTETQADMSNDYHSAIIQFVSEKSFLDLKKYKKETVFEKLEQRLNELNISAKKYLKLIKLDINELNKLSDYFLVVVTEFYRDIDAFKVLNSAVIHPLVAKNKPLRIWVPGCATGEEAYSIAIELLEAFKNTNKEARFTIFATDICEKSLRQASKAVFSKERLAKLSPQQINAYFYKKDNTYVANDQLRKHLIFSQHDVSNDPPFTKLDFISCRYLLIYFSETARKQILSRFYFSLLIDGFMLLGPSENTGSLKDAFKPLDVKWKIFRKVEVDRNIDTNILLNLSSKINVKHKAHLKSEHNIERLSLLNQLARTGFLVDKDYQLIEIFGDANQFISFQEGQTNLNILKLVEQDLANAIRSTLIKADRYKQKATKYFTADQQNYEISSEIIAAKHDKFNYFIDIVSKNSSEKAINTNTQLNPVITRDSLGKIENKYVDTLELTIIRKDEELQSAVEELESTNEELTASNEELVASNEELQAVNEELHSVNQELTTVNFEYQEKLHAISQANNDLINLHNVAEIGTVFIDKDKKIRSFSPLLTKKFNFIEQDIGRPIEHLIYNLNVNIHKFKSAIDNSIKHNSVHEFEAEDHTGAPYWLRLIPYLNSEGVCEGAAISLTEISQLKNAQGRASEKAKLSQSLLASTPGINYIYVFGEGRTVLDGNSITDMLGYSSHEQSVKGSLKNFIHRDDLSRLDEHNTILQLSKEGEIVNYEFRVQNKAKQWLWMETRETVHKRDANGKVTEVLGIALDISSRKNIEEKLQYDALHDSLTGLKNRLAFVEHLSQTHKDFLRFPDQNYSVFFIDLNKFKIINDTYGHSAGDHILKTVGLRILESVRNVDIVARYSGDEFVVLVKNINNEDHAVRIAKKILSSIEKDVTFKGVTHSISASVGVAMANPNQKLPEYLINSADAAMYKAKNDIDNKIHIFNDALHSASVENKTLEQQLRVALFEDNLDVHYQPIIDLQTNKIVALEALARWTKNGKNVPTEKFIPLAESTNLINKIDQQIYNKITKFLNTTQTDLRININISAQQLNNNNAVDYLYDNQHIAKQVCIEITESQNITKNSQAQQTLVKLRDFGYEIAIDDFGTGYSSLSYLMNIPAQIIKIDKGFIANFDGNAKSLKIIKAILNLSESLNYHVVAEGIETQKQLDFIRSMQCNYAQGYLFHKPMPESKILELINS